MKQNNTQVDNIITQLLSKREATFKYTKYIDDSDVDNNMKIEIIKTLCLTEDKLSIKNIFKSNYSDIIIDSVVAFLKSLQNLSLKGMINSYEPEDERIKENRLFKSYLKFTKRELLPFFLMLGFYSYVNLKKNNIQKIKEFQSNIFFTEINIKYIQSKIKLLPNILDYYCDIILNEKNEERQSSSISKEELKYLFNNYSFYNDTYNKGDIFELISNIFKAITKNLNSLYLREGKDYDCVNELIISLLDILIRNLWEKTNYNNIDDIIDSIFDLMAKFKEIYHDANYANFVMKYCKKFNYNKKDDAKLYTICLFFCGLNPSNFEETFKEIKIFYGNNYYKNIEKYYSQINVENENNKTQAYNYDKKIGETDDFEIKSNEFSDNLKKMKLNNGKYEQKDIKKENNELCKDNDISKSIQETQKENINKEFLKAENKTNNENEESIDIEKKNGIKFENENCIKNESKKSIQTKVETAIINKNEDYFIKKDEEDKRKLNVNFDYSQKINQEEIYEKMVQLQLELKETKDNLKRNQEGFDKYKRTIQEEFENLKKRAKKELEKGKKENDALKSQIFTLNKELSKVKDDLSRIKLRDISKIIINKYINKNKNKLILLEYVNFMTKKDKSYEILKILKGKEQYYFRQLIDKYFESNDKSHISGLFGNYNNVKGKNIVQDVKRLYISKIFDLNNVSNLFDEKIYISNLFGLDNIIWKLYNNN